MKFVKRINHFAAAGMLALATVLGTVVVPQSASALSGNGSAENPWQLSTCTQLKSIVYEWGEWEAAESHDAYVLTGNIDCTGVAFESLKFGEGGGPFNGTLDGAGHTISNLTINEPNGTRVGLFSRINEGTVRNLTLANVAVTGQNIVGALAGSVVDSDIENVHITSGTVNGTSEDYDNYIGGLVGDSADARYLGVTTNVTVNAPYTDQVGGLIGYSGSDSIEQSGAYGSVTGHGDVGGLVGYASGSDLSWVHAKGNVTGSWTNVGGLVGTLEDGTVANSYARGSVSGVSKVGGLIGEIVNNFSLSYNYSTGHVTVVPDGDAGGLIGQINSEGGYLDETNFWDVESSGYNTNHGNDPIGETTANMKTKSTFTAAGWDFEEEPIWGIGSGLNDGYPCHAWEGSCETSDSDGGGEVEIDGNTANLTTATGSKAVALTVDDSCTLSDVSTINAANTTVKDAAYTYSTGFVRFTATGCEGNTAHVQLRYHGVSPDNLVARKYNPNKNSYFTITGATITKDGDDTLVSYAVTDGGDLDIDGAANNSITDPVGLGVLAVGVPNTGLGGGR